MARKSPRSRKKQVPKARARGGNRPRSSPGKRASAPRARTSSARRPGFHGRKARGSPPTTRARRARAARGPSRTPRRTRQAPPEPARVAATLGILEGLYPEATTALDFRTPLQLLVATILSAQCTDRRVNMVTPGLFARYPDASSFAKAVPSELEEMIRSTGFFRNKARAIRECCADIEQKYGGEVPRTMEEMTQLRGVGRKTANVVLGNAFGIPGVVVDTHVARLSNRLGLTSEHDPVKIEFALMQIVPKEKWTRFSHWLILHGRRVCVARKPRCSVCTLAPHCPRVGVKAAS